jgi:hypothetical protein
VPFPVCGRFILSLQLALKHKLTDESGISKHIEGRNGGVEKRKKKSRNGEMEERKKKGWKKYIRK